MDTDETQVIYKIVCKNPEILDFYIGSTLNLAERIRSHTRVCKLDKEDIRYQTKLYNFINDNGGFENFRFEILYTDTFIDKRSKEIAEQYYIDLLKPTLNTDRAYATKENNLEKSRKYYHSEKGQEWWINYYNSGKQIEAIKKYQESEHGKAVIKAGQEKYKKTEKCKEARKKADAKRKENGKYQEFRKEYVKTEKYKLQKYYSNVQRRSKRQFLKVINELNNRPKTKEIL